MEKRIDEGAEKKKLGRCRKKLPRTWDLHLLHSRTELDIYTLSE